MEKNVVVSPGAAEGERSSTGAAPQVKRWSANRKKEVVLRLMHSEHGHSARSETESQNPHVFMDPATTRRVTALEVLWALRPGNTYGVREHLWGQA